MSTRRWCLSTEGSEKGKKLSRGGGREGGVFVRRKGRRRRSGKRWRSGRKIKRRR